MIIVRNLKNVFTSRKTDAVADGLYEKNDVYYATFFHGGRLGELSIEVSSGEIIIISPFAIRELIKLFYHFTIPDHKRIVIFPCHPKIVRQENYLALRESHIGVLGNWTSVTRLGVVVPPPNFSVATSEYVIKHPSDSYDIVANYKYMTASDYMREIHKKQI